MKLIDVILENEEGSGDLKRKRDLFVSTWKKIMSSKTRNNKLNYIENLIDDIMSKDEKKFLILQLQKNK